MNLALVAPFLQKKGVYGPPTATLDWCEVNHQFSPYIAEMANSFSNLFTVTLSVIGYLEATRQGLPARYSSGYAGVALVGIGSFFFHATLLFEAQLADELPMIYVASMSLFLLWDSEPGFGLAKRRTKGLIGLLALFDGVFTWSYMLNRNPLYHQLTFALLVLSTALRISYILKHTPARTLIPPHKKKSIISFFSTGAAIFALGFVVWNLDNIFCGVLTRWKVSVGWPAAFLLEGHSWWHVLTVGWVILLLWKGLNHFFFFLGPWDVLYVHWDPITLCAKDDPKHYEVYYRYWLPHVAKLKDTDTDAKRTS
ncbi:hypothetical protein CVT26_004865 [Gymnopilus dilepis]|uniref:Alkaline phytoceramidase n=1 Tax=Gymnopilus dilepis TaxID=231916 RepID=A0A409WZ49_9AGAR|nr:hypothetical protein CVT26_004865 [Gymnopilus dilepis]